MAVLLFTAVPAVHGQAAQSIRSGLRTAGDAADLATDNTDLPTIVGELINAVLGFIGVLLLVYLIYGGFLWMTAAGGTENVTKAKSVMRNAIIGILIVVFSFAISDFVLGQLVAVTTGANVTSGPPA